ncbi:TAP-like protein [Streptomyces sp. WMMB 714]|uniref:alpha/beta hydrolase n=1 Tax=Streptomyces sp. WMMB 714 TaxID=1286822 RepID=UPI0005F7C918|nr:alpha/beta hydrolase [Streptomyces sp. WMMB 714]SCK43307.1 TAP-like protein [Streptomyces sp. WMMB 714]
MRSVALHGALSALVLTAAAVVPSGSAPEVVPFPLRDAREKAGTASAASAAAAAGIDWTECPAAEQLPAPVECGKVTVPVDYARPAGEKIRLTVSRRGATGPARQGALLYNPGGPGGNGMSFPMYAAPFGDPVWRKLNKAYDFVGYAPRGVGRSAPLKCGERAGRAAARPARSPRDPSAAYKRAMRRKAAAYATACAARAGDRLDHFTTPDNARDLEVLRAALGSGKLNFVGTSYGSYLGAVYATLFPGRVRRLVLDSVVDPRPGRVWYRSDLEQNIAFERRWLDWKRWVARNHSVYRLGRTPRAVQREFDKVRTTLDARRVGGSAGRDLGSRQLLADYVRVGYDAGTWPRHAAALSAFRHGDPRPLVAEAAPDRHGAAARANSDAVHNAVKCSDAPWPRDFARWDRDSTAVARKAPFQTWENTWTNLPCAYWHGKRSRPVDVGARPGALPPVLLLAATRDPATPYEGAVRTWQRLPGSSLVTERGAGTHGVAGGNACVDRRLTAYLLHGRTPGRAAECAARPVPRPLPDGS